MPIYDIGFGTLSGGLFKITAEINENNDIKMGLGEMRTVFLQRSFARTLVRNAQKILDHFLTHSGSSCFIEDEDRIAGYPTIRAEVYAPNHHEVYIKPYLDLRVWMPKYFGSTEMSRTSMGIRIPSHALENLFSCINETD